MKRAKRVSAPSCRRWNVPPTIYRRRLEFQRLEDRLLLATWSGTLADGTVWGATPGEVEILNGIVTVPEGATLTIRAGAIIKPSFGGGGLDIAGRVVTEGTALDPIHFTSIRDDSVGGDTNGDGGATTPAAANWRGLRLTAATADVALNHVQLRYAGASVPATLQVDGGNFNLDHVTFGNNGSGAIQFNATAAGAYNLTDVTITGIGSFSNGVSVNSADATINATNLAIENVGAFFPIRTVNAGRWNSTGTALTGPGFKAIAFQGGTITDTRAWDDTAIYHLTSNITVDAAASLTLPAGAVVKSSGAGRLTVQGSLIAAGSEAEPVIFTSIHDDTVAGDTNGNGSATAPAAGNWFNLVFSGPSFSGDLDRLEVHYAFGSAIDMSGGTLDLRDSLVTNVGGINSIGVSITGGSALLERNTVRNVNSFGLDLNTPSGAVTLIDTTIENAASGAYRLETRTDLTATGTTSTGSGLDNAIRVNGTSIEEHLTWQEDLTYFVTNLVTIQPTASLTVAPGTIVKFGSGLTFTVAGVLNAQRTATDPATMFTTFADDSVGGDTNEDGSATLPSPTSGYVVNINGGTANLDQVELRYLRTGGIPVFGGAIAVTDGQLNLTNSLVRDVQTNAVAVNAGADGVNLSGTTIRDVGNNGVSANITSDVLVRMTDLTVENAVGFGVQMHALANVDLDGAMFVNTDRDGAVRVLESTITGTRFWAAQTYVLGAGGDLTVGTTGDLTIGAGAILKFEQFSGVQNDGKLTALGTAADPVIFTSIRDDSVGGDSNEDGNASSPFAGDWFNYWHRDGFMTTNNTAQSDLENVEIRYAGGESAFASTPSLLIDGGMLTATNLLIEHALDAGLRSRWSPDNQVTVSNLTIRDTAAEALSFGVTAPGGGNVAIQGVHMQDVSGDAVVIDPELVSLSLNGITMENVSGLNGTRVRGGNLQKNLTLGHTSLVVVEDAVNAVGGSLTILPGTTLKMLPNALITANQSPLIAEGTADEAIVFTSLFDDSAGGDTNGDGVATLPGPGDWPGISLLHPDSRLRYSEIRHAGNRSGDDVAVLLANGTHELANLTIHSTTGDAVRSSAAEFTLINTLLFDYEDTGVEIDSGNAVTLINNTIHGGQTGVDLSSTSATLANNSISGASQAGVRAGNALQLASRHNNLFNPNAANGNLFDAFGTLVIVDDTGNVSADPLFADVNRGDFELGSSSQLIDAADGDLAPERDALERIRIDDSTVTNTGIGVPDFVDIGALEKDRWFSVIDAPKRSGAILQGDTLRFAGTGTADPGPPRFRWNFQNGQQSSVEDPGLVTFTAAGQTQVTFEANSSDNAVDLNPASLTLDVIANNGPVPDLAVEQVRATGNLALGVDVRIDYRARNLGPAEISGRQWRDALFLSQDAFLDRNDVLLSSSIVSENLPEGSSYDGQFAFRLTDSHLKTAANYLIVSVDDDWEVLERHQLNNESALFTDALITELEDGVAVNSAFSGEETGQFFRIDVGPGQQLSVQFDDADDQGINELYLRRGALPTRSQFDVRHAAGVAADRRAVNKTAAPGTWYILAYGTVVPPPGAFTIQADLKTIALESVMPNRHGNAEDAVLTLAGAGFTAGTGVELVASDGTAFAASASDLDSFSQITATFVAGNVPAGIYDVRVTNAAGASDELVGVFEMLEGGQSNFVVNLVVPAIIGLEQPATLYLEYANTGDIAMPAPLLHVVGTSGGVRPAKLTLDPDRLAVGVWSSAEQPEGFSNTIRILGSGQTAGVLQPGESRRVPIYYAGSSDRNSTSIEWQVEVLTVDNQTPVDWESHREPLRPSAFSPDAWDVIFDIFVQAVGPTFGDLVTTLNENAAYLGRLGQQVVNVDALLDFEVQQANGFGPVEILAFGVDAALATPGIGLGFARAFTNSISARYRLGPFGRGWSHMAQISLFEDADGTVSVFGMNSSERRFNRDNRGGYFAAPEEEAVLTQRIEGGFLLTERDGSKVAFRPNGQVEFLEDINANRVTFVYTDQNLTRLEHSNGKSLEIRYNAANRIESVLDSEGRETLYFYDASNEHLLSVQHPDGRVTQYQYASGPGPDAHALTQEVANGVIRAFSYDQQGRLVSVREGTVGDTFTFSYDSAGTVSVMDALGGTRGYSFDHLNRVVRTEDPFGNIYSLSYSDYEVTKVVDPSGHTVEFAYDQNENVIAFTDPLGHQTQYAYRQDIPLQPTQVVDANGNGLFFEYDAAGNVTDAIDNAGGRDLFEYNSAGNVTRLTDGRNRFAEFAYDGLGRQVLRRTDDGAETEYEYDARDNLVAARAAAGDIILEYNDDDRITRILYPNGRFLAYTYDAVGRRTSVRDQSGHELRYEYDAAGRLQRLTDEQGTSFVAYTYNDLGSVTEQRRGNGLRTTYAYDVAQRLIEVVNRNSDDTVLSTFAYQYDALGRRTGVATDKGNWTYKYDSSAQLVEAQFTSTDPALPDQQLLYEYDAVGNRIRTVRNGVVTGYETNDLNQYTAVGQVIYEYDEAGNLTKQIAPEGTTTYTYDVLGRLIAVVSPLGERRFEYDALDNLVAVIDEEGNVTELVTDPAGLGNLFGVYDALGNLVTHYVHGNGLVAQMTSDDSLRYYAFDGGQNVTELVNAASDILNSYAYLPFGQQQLANETVDNPFTFAGGAGVAEHLDGQYYMRFRWYDPGLGRFTQRDPIGLAGGDVNLYRYVANSPIGFFDPTGTFFVPGGFSISRWDIIKAGTSEPFFAGPGDPSKPGLSTIPSGKVSFIVAGEGIFAIAGAAYLDPDVNPGQKEEDFWRAGFLAVGGAAWGIFAGHIAVATGGPIIAGAGGYMFGKFLRKKFPAIDDYMQWTVEALDETYGGVLVSGSNFIVSLISRFRFALDPNQKLGPAGFGPENFVSPDGVIGYRVDFENDESATAPAQFVTVTDQLGPDLNWDTFALTEVGFGDVVIGIPAGSQQFATAVPVTQNGKNFQVQIAIEFQRSTGQIIARLFSVDPETGLPPDVETGFLPPEDGTGRGQGHFSYTIEPVDGLATGMEIRNIAIITFGGNPPIATNQVDPLDPSKGTDPAKEALVTIDATRPTSSVNPLPALVPPTFTVTWGGSDVGAGIATFDVYVSEEGGPFTLWQDDTPATSGVFAGVPERSYAFYSVATDLVGNVEADPAMAQAMTTTSATALPGDYSGNGIVDAADYVVWRDTLGAALTPFTGADGDGDGVVDQDDHGVWRAHFGMPLPAGATAGPASSASDATGSASASAAGPSAGEFGEVVSPPRAETALVRAETNAAAARAAGFAALELESRRPYWRPSGRIARYHAADFGEFSRAESAGNDLLLLAVDRVLPASRQTVPMSAAREINYQPTDNADDLTSVADVLDVALEATQWTDSNVNVRYGRLAQRSR